MLDSILPTPVKLTHSEILFSAAATLAFQVIEEGGRPIIRLSRLCEKPQYGYTASAQAERVGPRFLRITDIKAGRVDWKNVPYCDCPEPEKYLLKPGDILVARSGSVGKSFLVSECPEPTVFASYMIRMRAKPGVLAGYVYLYLQTQQFWFQIKESKRGSAMKNINSKMLSSSRIPDATPSQQKAVVSFLIWFQNRIDGDYKTPPPEVPELLDVPRIVARIEELAALIEEAQGLRVKAREEAEALLGSELNRMFDQPRDGELPSGWSWFTIGALLREGKDGIRTGPFGTLLNKSDFQPRGVPLIGIACIDANKFYPGRCDYIFEEKAEELAKYEVVNGDVIVARSGTVGRCCVVENLKGPTIMSSNLMRLRFNMDKCDPRLACQLLNSSALIQRQIDEKCRGTTRTFFNQKILTSMEVPLPDVHEQCRIVAYLDSLQAQVDELTALQDAAQAELDALLPSVLDRAFRGEL